MVAIYIQHQSIYILESACIMSMIVQASET